MDTAEKRLDKSVTELLQAIDLCNDCRLWIPALILLYVGIDFAASLDRTDSTRASTKSDFLAWVDKYLLPGTELKCSAIDLYAARCGWVHTYTSKNRLVDEAKAKEINYQFGPYDDERALQESVKNPSVAVIVHFTRLFNAFGVGLDKWKSDFLSSPDQRARVLVNSEKLLHRTSSCEA